MKPSVILYKTLPDDLLQHLEEHFSVTQVKNLRPETVSQHAEAFAQAEGLLGSSEKVDAALLEKMPKLRATSTVSVGYDNFDVEALNARRVLLMHTPTVLTETVADTVMALVLSTARRVVEVAERVKAGEWTKSIGPDWFGTDVHHKTLGIVGMGRIGMALAQRAHFGFGMPILYNARRQHPQAEERFNASGLLIRTQWWRLVSTVSSNVAWCRLVCITSGTFLSRCRSANTPTRLVRCSTAISRATWQATRRRANCLAASCSKCMVCRQRLSRFGTLLNRKTAPKWAVS